MTAITGVIAFIDQELDPAYSGCTITVKNIYQYDEYEGFGKWYMVDASFKLW